MIYSSFEVHKKRVFFSKEFVMHQKEIRQFFKGLEDGRNEIIEILPWHQE